MTPHQAFIEAYIKWQASVPGDPWQLPTRESEALWLAYVTARDAWLSRVREAAQTLPPAAA